MLLQPEAELAAAELGQEQGGCAGSAPVPAYQRLISSIRHPRVSLKAIALSATAWVLYHLQTKFCTKFLEGEIIEMLLAWKLLSAVGVS